jgi:phospholipid/cholesterol/gamma-HCH transport system substrate-binding protein
MITKETTRNIRVGVLVSVGTLLLIFALYTIGNKQNIFGSTFNISATFQNVNGLMTGNNVRFAGIDVGTVKSIEIINDSSVRVNMMIENRIQPFIKKNAIASVGTDGLMGNKLININAGGNNNNSESIEDKDVLRTQRPIETDEMLRTLNRTNDNVSNISENLKVITQKINSPNTIWSILMDTVVALNVKEAIVSLKTASNNASSMSNDLTYIIKDVKAGKGSLGSLLVDTLFSNKVNTTMSNFKLTGDTLNLIAGDLKYITQKIKKGEGAVGTILSDTAFTNNLNKSMINIKNGSQGFNDNMEALKHNFLLRNYFKKQEKEKGKKK